MTDTISLANVTHEFAATRILAFASDDRLVQGEWHSEAADGREIACLLGAIHHDIDSESDCPARLMPYWMARLTVRLFDGVRPDQVRHYAEAYAGSIRRWDGLTTDGWARVRLAFIQGVGGGAFDRAAAMQPDPPYAWWPESLALHARLKAYLLDTTSLDQAGRRKLYDDAWTVRQKLWGIRNAKIKEARVARAAASGVGGGTPVAAAEAVAAEAVAAEAVAAEAEAEAEAAEAEAVAAAVARSTSYAQSFDILLETISAELDRAA